MLRFYFHVRYGTELVMDLDRSDLSNLNAA